MNTGRRLLGQAKDILHQFRIVIMHDLGQIPAIIKDEIRTPAVRSFDCLDNAPEGLFFRFPFPGENGNTGCGNSGSRLILRRENIAGGPAHFRAQRCQRFNQNRRLDGHVKATRNARALQRLFVAKLFAQRHQARHFGFRNGNFLAAPVGQRHIRDLEVFKFCHVLLFRIKNSS